MEIVDRFVGIIMESHSCDMSMVFTSKDALLQFGWDCLNINHDHRLSRWFALPL